MKTYMKILLCGVLGAMLFVPVLKQSALAEDSANDPVAEKMKPLLEEDTLCVVHVDLTKINTAAILNNNRAFVEKAFIDLGGSEEEFENLVRIAAYMPDDMDIDETWQKMLVLVEGGKTMLTEMLGVKEAYVVLGTGQSFMTFFYVALPMTEDLNVEAIRAMIPKETPFFVRETEDYLLLTAIYSPPHIYEKVEDSANRNIGPKRPVERADLLAAYDAVKDYPVRILFATPPYIKRIVAELRPGLPQHVLEQLPALRKIDVPAMVNGFRFEGIGIDLEAGKLVAVTETETELDAQLIVRQMDVWAGVLIDEYVKYLEQLAEQKKESDMSLTPREEILLTLYSDVFSRESLVRLKDSMLPQPKGNRITVQWDRETTGEQLSTSGLVLTKLIQINVETARESTRRMHCANNMKQLGLTMHTYHDAHGSFPPTFSVDANGKPLHSWRVHVLPFSGHSALYEAIRLDEPWDSEHNKQFHNAMPAVFRCPSCTQGDPKRDTTYCMVVGEESLGRTDGTGLKLKNMTDGTSNTVMFVERKTPVCWMAPEDMSFEDAVQGVNKIDTGIGSEHYHVSGANVTLGDGSIQFIHDGIDLDILRAVLTISGGESHWSLGQF